MKLNEPTEIIGFVEVDVFSAAGEVERQVGSFNSHRVLASKAFTGAEPKEQPPD